MKKTRVYFTAFMLAALVLNGCSNMFLEKPRASGDIPGGFGTVAVSLTRGTARTVIPELELTGLYLKYLFAKDGGADVAKAPEGGKFVLEPGSYRLTVQVFTDAAKQIMAAQGTTENNFTISAGTDAGTVNLALRPLASGTGAGELAFKLEYPTGAAVETLTLTRIAGDESPYDLTGTAGIASSATGLSGTKTGIPVGYYMLRVVVKNSGGASAGRTEAVHIYQNLKSEAAYVFIADDFRIYRVSSAADSGPGSLRRAVTDAQSMGGPQTIQVVLEPGAVIELKNALPPITESLTIEGNGATLTRAESWGSSYDSQLLRITGTTAEVLIRRLHFKNGLSTNSGGAVNNAGKLILESCVFSGNRSESSGSGVGGAIYASNDLTIRGCTFYQNTAGSNGGAVNFTASGKTLTLTGNLFYGNKGGSTNMSPAVRNLYNTPTTNAAYNVVDAASGTGINEAGWDFGTGDKEISPLPEGLPVSGKTFKLLYGSGAGHKLPETLPAGYPDTDFHGGSISGGGAAGAVQAGTANQSGHYYVEFSVSDSARGRIDDSGQDEDGLYPAGSLITAEPEPPYAAGYWLANGKKEAFLTISGHAWARAVFTQTLTVNNPSDEAGSGDLPGTLRHALTKAGEGDTIVLSGITGIELKSPLPGITKTLTIEGNGATLTRAEAWSASYTSQLLRITDAAAEALIRRIHFKNGLAETQGGAVYNYGNLTLESCVFSGNRVRDSDGYGGAVYSGNTLTVRGCTFYGNTAVYYGGAICFQSSGKPLTLTGNLFYGNTCSQWPVVCNVISGPVTASYNVVDKAPGTNSDQAGWTGGTDDTFISGLPVSPRSFKLLYGSGALDRLPAGLPADYPDTDFYGNGISGEGAAGAVQTKTANQEGYYCLELSANNSELGTVTATPDPDEDGLYHAGVTIDITANPTGGYATGRWLVNGERTSAAPKNLSSHTSAQAIFGRRVMVNDFTDGPGSEYTPGTLRHALNNAEDGDLITLSGVGTIELKTPLPYITKSLIIDGNGATLTRAASWTNGGGFSQMLITRSGSGEILVRRLHFKGGPAFCHENGNLTLESCIFSGNRINLNGGAVYSADTLTIRGCTFYDNTADYGGAVYFAASEKTLTLTGNLFYQNNAKSVVYIYPGSAIISYNVVDKAFGPGNTLSGWNAGDGDVYIQTGKPIETDTGTFAPNTGSPGHTDIDIVPSGLPGFPDTDFNGTLRTFPGAAGAVK